MLRLRNRDSLTGSDCGSRNGRAASVGIALAQLRLLVLGCCAVVILGLVAQTAAWALASYTDVRFERFASDGSDAPLVIDGDRAAAPAARPAGSPFAVDEPVPETADPNRVASTDARRLEVATGIAAALVRLAATALLPFAVLGVMLGAGSATAGVEKLVSAFSWSVMTVLLVFPIAARFGMPWQDGAAWEWSGLIAVLDAAEAAGTTPGGMFLLQYAVLPGVSMLAVGLCALRFASGVEQGLLMKEELGLDPSLEREAADVKPASLHAGRAAHALEEASAAATMGLRPPPEAAPEAAAEAPAEGAAEAPVAGRVPGLKPLDDDEEAAQRKPMPRPSPSPRRTGTDSPDEPPPRLMF